mgnify:CR=1 FL=1
MSAWGVHTDDAVPAKLHVPGSFEINAAPDVFVLNAHCAATTSENPYASCTCSGLSVVEQLNVEDGGEFKVSSADYLLGQI